MDSHRLLLLREKARKKRKILNNMVILNVQNFVMVFKFLSLQIINAYYKK